MNNQKILELAEQLFLRNPYDKPEKLFKLATEFEDYINKWEAERTLNQALADFAGQSVSDMKE